MKRKIRPVVATALACIIAFFAFSYWYDMKSAPLSEEEIIHFLTRIDELPDSSRQFLAKIGVEQFMREDDGAAFHVLNLFQFQNETQGDSAENSKLASQTAIARFARSILPLWLKHGGYPVFSMQISQPSATEKWDFVSVVHYRSRRDFMEIVVDEGYQRALPDRLSATKLNLRIVSAGNEFPAPLTILCLFIIVALTIAYVVERRMFPAARIE